MKSPSEFFSELPDPRVDRTTDHLLTDIIFITIAAVKCNCETWNVITVTIDAMGCQTNIAEKIVEKNANYILAVKGNQGLLEQGIQDTILFAKPVSMDEDIDTGHGRIETRICSVYDDLSH